MLNLTAFAHIKIRRYIQDNPGGHNATHMYVHGWE